MIDHIRKSSEAIILVLVVASPWSFGSVHPFFRYCLTAGITILLLLWSIELLVTPRTSFASRFQLPILGLIAIVAFQIMPLGGTAVDWLSPKAAELQRELFPQAIEHLADNTPAVRVSLPARGRVSLYPAETLRRLYWFTLLGLLFTRTQDLASSQTLRRLCYACMINGGILSFFSVIQHFTTAEHGMVFWKYQSRGAAFGPFINRNHFAFYVNICFGLSLGLLGSRQMGKFSKLNLDGIIDSLKDAFSLWMGSVLVFMLGAVILCSSRGGMISLLGAMVITAVFVASTGSFHGGWKWFVLAAVIFGLAAGLQIWLGFDFVDSRYAIHDDNRTQLWMPLLQLVRQFPLMGSGLGTLAYVEPLTRSSGQGFEFFVEYAHNEYLQLATETGIPGLLCGCVLLWMLAAKIARRIRESRHNAWLYVGLLFSLSTIALHSFAEFGLSIPAIAVLAAVVAGSIAGVGRVKPRGTDTSPKMAFLIRGAAVGMLIFGFFAIREAKLTDLAERSYVLAQRAHLEGKLQAEIDHYEDALSYTPDNVELLLDSSRLLLVTKKVATSESTAELLKAQNDLVAARELCPLAADAHFLIARHIETFAAAEDQLVHYLRARKARPADATLAYLAGWRYLKLGDLEEAANQFNASLSLAPKHLRDILPLVIDEMDSLEIRDQLLPSDANTLALAANWYESRVPDDVELPSSIRKKALATEDLTNANSADSHYLRATLLAKIGENDKAIQSYRSAILYSPENLNWRFQLIGLLIETEQYKPAHQQIKNILRQKGPNFGPALNLRREVIKRESQLAKGPDVED